MLKKTLGMLAILGLTVARGECQEADSVALSSDGVIVSLSVFGHASHDMQDTYGLVPSLGVRGSLDTAPQVSAVCGVNLLQKNGEFYSGPGLVLQGQPTRHTVRLRAALGEFGLRVNSVPRAPRNLFLEGGIYLAWAGERFREADDSISEKDHSGTGMGGWFGFGAELFLKESISWGLQGRFNLCSVRVRYDRADDYLYPSHYSINLGGVTVATFLGFYR